MAASPASLGSPRKADRATYRTVVLLQKRDKIQLQRLASKEKVTTAELIRRLIRSGDEMLKNGEEEAIEAALKMITSAAHEANESLVRTIDKLDALHLELEKRTPA